MSVQAMAAIKAFLLHPSSKDLPLRGRHTSVLGWLGDECQDDMSCWPSLTRIAQVTKMSRRSVIRVIEELNAMRGPGFEQGLVTVVGSYQEDTGWATNLYELHIPEVPRQMRKRRALRIGVKLTPVSVEGTGDKMTPVSTESGDKLSPVEKSTGDKTDTKLVTKQHDTTEQQQEPLLLLAAGGGQDGSSSDSAAPEKEKKELPLDERLLGHGVYEHLVCSILVKCTHKRIREQCDIYEKNLALGATHEVGVLVRALTGGPDVKPVKPRRKKKPDEPGYLKPRPPEKPKPPHEVTWCCKICGEAYSRMSDESLTCPNCSASVTDQEAVALVAKGVLPHERLERLPAKAREVLKNRIEVTG